MKKGKLLLPLLTLLFTGCKGAKENTAPTIEGVTGIECAVNTTVDLLSGITAYDEEDGDITPDMEISIAPEVSVFNGYAVFDKAGNYKITYTVKDSAGLAAVKAADIAVVDRELYLDFKTVNGFYTTVSGHAELLKGGMYNGVYAISAKDCEVAEDIALSRIYTLDSGYEYTFRYFLSSETAGRVRVLADGEFAAEQQIHTGDNTIEFTYTPAQKNNVTISLLLGALGDRVDCQFTKAETSRPQPTGWTELLQGISAVGRFDGTALGSAGLIDDGTAGLLQITQTASEMWQGGMFIQTNVQMEPGRQYTVSFQLKRSNLYACEISLQNQQWEEKKYQHIRIDTAENETSHEFTIAVTEENKGSLWIYVQSGTALNEIRLSGLSVKTYVEGVQTEEYVLSDFVNYNDGYSCTLQTYPGGFRYLIETFGDTDYQQRVASPEFYISGSGKNFIVSFKAKTTRPVEVVFAAPVAGGWDPTWVWSKFTIAEEERVYTFSGNDTDGDYRNLLVWQFGSVKNQKYSHVEIEIWDIQISYKNSEYDGD